MMNVQKYPAYQDSGVEWLGEIPEHWEVIRSKRLFRERKEKALINDEQLTSSQKHGIISQKEYMEIEGRRVTQVEFNRSILKHVEANDFVISMRSFQGGIEYSHQTGCISSAYVPLVPIKHVVVSFFKYLFKSDAYIKALSSTSNLVRDGQAMRFDNFEDVDLMIIPLEEQTAIAQFLDRKTALIDQAIDIKQKQIELLKERRQILIHQAVTRGLNPEVKMKDSGVEWIGEVPEHWEVTSIKHVLEMPICDGPHTTPQLYDEGFPFVSAEAIKNGEVDFEKIRGFISLKDFKLFSKKYSPKRNDIYMVKSGATTGNVAIVKTDIEFSIWSPLAVFRANQKKVIPNYLFNYLESPPFKTGVELSWSFGTQQNIGMGVLSNLPIAYPSIDEQIQISKHINLITEKINSAITLKQQEIAKLQEYKATLINSAVTGKIKVGSHAQ